VDGARGAGCGRMTQTDDDECDGAEGEGHAWRRTEGSRGAH
jgi:hypothetical protein